MRSAAMEPSCSGKGIWVSSNSPRPQSNTFWTLSEAWSQALARAGFDVAAAVELGSPGESWLASDLERWRAWLAEGAHATMNFMEKNEEARTDARFVLEDARSAIVVLAPYATGKRVRGGAREPERLVPAETTQKGDLLPRIARYARGADYHKVLKKRLETAASEFNVHPVGGPALRTRVVVDSIPFFDRAHAREAGLGFVGKNTMFIRPGMGSYFFVATLLTDAPIATFATPRAPDALSTLDCGDCRKCLDACPTGALPEPYFLDARRCLSYLTIENRGEIPDAFLPHLKNTIYGCDICQEVCPYNIATSDLVRIPELGTPRASLLSLTTFDVAGMTEREYENWFGGMAMTRAKYGGLVRNALCVLFAEKDPRLAALLAARGADPQPLIARTCAQLARLLGSQALD